MTEKTEAQRVLDNILYAMKAQGLSPRALSLAAGLNPGAINDMIRGKATGLRHNTLAKIASALNLGIGELFLADMTTPGYVMEKERFGYIANPTVADFNVRRAPNPWLDVAASRRARDVPVFGTAEAGPKGAMDINLGSDLQVDWATRPRMLAGIKEAFAFYVVGSSMEPRWLPGELVYVNPTREPAPGSPVLVVLQGNEAHQAPRAFFKRLLRRTATKIVLTQSNPEIEIEISIEEVKNLWRAYEWGELLDGM